MLSRKRISRRRILRLADLYGPFVRFFPEGSEGTEDDDLDDVEITDAEATANAIKDAEEIPEEVIKSSRHYQGTLRDLKEFRSQANNLSAENAALRLELEKRNQQSIAEQNKTEEPELSEEELNTEVTRGELIKSQKQLRESLKNDLISALDERENRNRTTNLKRSQATDAKNLLKTHTEKAKGPGLDAKTVVDEAIAYLKFEDPETLEVLAKKPDFTSRIYKYAVAFIPEIAERAQLRKNSLLANKLDQSGDDIPGGSESAMKAFSDFEQIMTMGAEETIYSD